MAFIDELFSGIGKGIGGVATAAWKASGPGSKLHRMDRADMQSDLKNDFAVLQQIDNPEDQQRHLQDMVKKYPKLVQLSDQMSNVMTQTLSEQREQEKWNMLDQTEKKDMATRDQWGRRPQTTDEIGVLDEGERWMAIAKGASSDELALKAEKKAESLLFPPEEQSVDAGAFSSRLFGPQEGPDVSNKSAATPTQPAQPGHSFAPGAAAPPVTAPTDNRGMFAGDENPFLTPESRAKVDSFLNEDLSPTESKQSPHTFEDIGIVQAGQQKEFQELEKMVQTQMPGVDIRQAYALHPESYKKLFDAIKNGVPDQKTGGTRKLTTKEIMQAIQSMGR